MWQYLVVYVIAMVVARVLAPKPQQPAPGDISSQMPTAEAGKEIPVLFGTRIIGQPNVVWWGDLLTKKIKSKGGKK